MSDGKGLGGSGSECLARHDVLGSCELMRLESIEHLEMVGYFYISSVRLIFCISDILIPWSVLEGM